MSLKCVIFYYSQSGGTKLITEVISNGFINKNNNCELIRFGKLQEDLEIKKNYDFSQVDLIGIGIPVYYFNPPNHILTILSKFSNLENQKCFLFCTSGDNPGSTLHQIKVLLNQNGFKIIDGNDGFMCIDKHQLYRDFNFVFPPSQGHPNEEDIQKAKNFANDVLAKAAASTIVEKNDF